MKALSLGVPFYHPNRPYKSEISSTTEVDYPCTTFMVGEIAGV